MPKEIKKVILKCAICGDVEIDGYFTGGDYEMLIPVLICPTLKDVARYYKTIVGSSYYRETGNQLPKSFEKRTIYPSHLDHEFDGYKEAEKHKAIKGIECWCEIV